MRTIGIVTTSRADYGIYVLEPDPIARVPQAIYFPFPAIVNEFLERSEPVGAFHVEQDWINIGPQSELEWPRGGADAS